MFQFEWPVDRDGYEWAHDRPGSEQPPYSILTGLRGWVIRPRGGPKAFYRPLEEQPGLFRRFASLPQDDRDAILEFTNLFGMLDGSTNGTQLDIIADRIERFHIITGALDYSSPLVAAVAFNDFFHPRFTVQMDAAKSPPRLSVEPTTLYGAMMLQVAMEISGTSKFKKCKQCPQWFPIGKKGATIRKEFCSDRCRVAWNRRQKREEA